MAFVHTFLLSEVHEHVVASADDKLHLNYFTTYIPKGGDERFVIDELLKATKAVETCMSCIARGTQAFCVLKTPWGPLVYLTKSELHKDILMSFVLHVNYSTLSQTGYLPNKLLTLH